MAVLDIKKCSFRIVDGRRATLAIGAGDAGIVYALKTKHHGTRQDVKVAHVCGAALATLSVAVANSDDLYTITVTLASTDGATPTSTAAQVKAAVDALAAAAALVTTSLPGTGASVASAAAAAAINTLPARYVEFKVGDGTLSWSETNQHDYVLNKGKLDQVKPGDEVAMSVDTGFTWEDFTAASVHLAAVVSSANAAPWNLAPGQTLVVRFNAGGDQTFTFNATRAVKAGAPGSMTPAGASTLLIKFNGGAVQTVTFAGTEADAADVADAITNQVTGGRAVVNAGNVDLESDQFGSGSSVQVTGGTANVATGQAVAAASTGTGNVADIDAVTMAEALAICAGITNGTVTNDGSGHLTFTSTTTGPSGTAQVKNTSTAAGFGFSNTATPGSDAATPAPLDALFQVGEAAAWVSTSDDPNGCSPYCVDLEVEINPNCSPEKREFLSFEEFYWDDVAPTYKDGRIAFKGMCNRTQVKSYRLA